MMSEEKIIIGKVNGFHGVKGFIKVFSETRPREGILHYKHFYIKQNGAWKMLEVEVGQKHSKHVLLKFKDYDTRDSVEPLLGVELFIEREDMPELDEHDSVYWVDLYGLKVINHEGVELGIIDDIFETGANDVLAVKGGKGEILIPFSLEFIVMEINLEEGFVQVDWDEE